MVVAVAATFSSLGAASPIESDKLPELMRLSIEQLADIEITSVSRRAERVIDAPASIYVITADDLHRSGAHSLPEALRLAPNLQVARVDASDYAISARGFNNSIGNKLLVLIDGRTVYTPLFSGVFWDAQDIMLEDVDRIEVISGPGASLWGANAVNGVINIITRTAQQTQGLLAEAYGGRQESGMALRYGGAIGDAGHYRVYVKGFDIDNTQLSNRNNQTDGWRKQQGGFRADWKRADDSFTVQGDAYRARQDGIPTLATPTLNGANLLARWTRPLADGGEIRAQTYFDHAERTNPIAFEDKMDIFDIEFQHMLPQDGMGQLLWGAGTRHALDQSTPGLLTAFIPGSRRLHWTNLFAQYEIAIQPQLNLTLGGRLETNVYTGLEYLPNIKLAWKVNADNLVWGALSRAVRAPSRIDRDFYFPGKPPYFINGGPDFQSEVANVIELGLRGQRGTAGTFSMTAFYHDYDKLRSGQPPPAVVQNLIEGSVAGVEAWGNYQATPDWRLGAGLLWQREDLRIKPGSRDPVGPSALGNDPRYQWTLHSAFAITRDHDVNISVRRVGGLPNPVVPGYTAVDARFVWRPHRRTEISLSVQNVFDPGHIEFGQSASASVIRRSVLLDVTWRI